MTNGNDFDDDLSDLIGRPMKPASELKQPPASYVQKDHIETCPKCNGTGRFVSWSGRVMGNCFACKGAGKKTFKTSADDRAKARDRSSLKKAQDAVAVLAASDVWKAENPAAFAWLETKRGSFEFAASLWDSLHKYGSLTDNQMAAISRMIAKDADRNAAREAAAPVVETAGIERLKEAFDKAAAFAAAKAKGLTVRNPKITIGGMTISPAKATSANPGALYVKGDGNYLGKIANGKFYGTGNCSAAQQEQILKFVADPAEAAKVYGQETGICCVCNATLRSEWRLKGIGPVCASKFGW
jgi:RNA polymerase subunit RPABC4/transcription elongation factor Spt4